MIIPFLKMHGAGNDFVIFDARNKVLRISAEQIEKIANRRFGIGCDQVIMLEPSPKADVLMRIYNADGSESGACGNASRCIAWLLMQENKHSEARVETLSGVLDCKAVDGKSVAVNMGAPKFAWNEIPLAEEQDTLHINLEDDGISEPAAVNMGNPHIVFFVDRTENIKLHEIGPRLERHPLFPQRVNVSIAEVQAYDAITLRVWERGAGETMACGTAACATLVAAHLRGYTGTKANIALPGGTLLIEWHKDSSGHVWMTGPVEFSFEGQIRVD